jgi:gliding motility-associated-like protein
MKDVLLVGKIIVLFLLGTFQIQAITTPSVTRKDPQNLNRITAIPAKESLVYNSIPDTIPLPPPPSFTCDTADIVKQLVKAGNIKLHGIDSSCSMYFINPQILSADDAQAYAKTFGGNLVSIQSAAENDAIGVALTKQGFTNKVVWIGFTDAKVEGTFEWYDGSPVTYTNWSKTGEPNNAGGNENCTQIFPDGFWNDLNCSLTNLSIIEISLCPSTKITPSKTTPICPGESVTLASATLLGAPNYTYSWTSSPAGFVSALASPVVTPTVTTTYSVTVTDRYKCSTQSTVTVVVNDINTTITASGPTTFCEGDSVILTASAGDAYAWSTGETTQSIKVVSSGNYSVKITKGICFGNVQKSVTVFPKPIPAFKNTTVCKGSATVFTDQSTGGTFWGWDFGDGSKGIGQNPNHTYAKAGIYTVTLGVVGAGNCVDSIKQLVTVHDTPEAAFFFYNSCSHDSIYFSNSSVIDPSTTVTSFLYDFGDGKTSNLPDPAHMYAKGGVYKVTLKITTADGCVGNALVNTQVNDSPTAIADIKDICSIDSAKFVNKSIINAGKIAKYYWNFGDGAAIDSNDWSPSHLYAPGTFEVMLVVVGAQGCTDTLRKQIVVSPSAIANFTTKDVCLNQPTIFTDLSTGPVQTYTWVFDDGNTGTDANPSHTYALPKTYNVTLTVITAMNCKTTITKKTTVYPVPLAKFTAPNVCEGKNVVFTDHSTIGGAPFNGYWNWNFDDGTTDTIVSPQHLYAAVKQYNVSLKVVTIFGCADSITKTITINPKPVVDFTTTDTAGCSPFKTSFVNQTTILSGKINKYLWEFGSINSKSDLKDPPPHIFIDPSHTAPVDYTIKLTATSDSGCVSSIAKTSFITVYPKPYAAFNVDPKETLLTNPLISVTNLSIGADSATWAFDSTGISSTLYNPPAYAYTDTGTYAITLIVSNLYGCLDTTSRTVIIEPDYVFYIPSAFTPNGDDINDTFNAKGSFIQDYEMTIYDRWGTVMYATKDINLPWTGGIKGSTVMAKSDVYVYVMKIKATNKRNYYYKGIVSLIR